MQQNSQILDVIGGYVFHRNMDEVKMINDSLSHLSASVIDPLLSLFIYYTYEFV